jgi:8-oxo-dGTP pyrophosphatase MutT (NUDIX family)
MIISTLRRAYERVIQRVLHVYRCFLHSMTLGVLAIVLDNNGRIFLVKHSYVAGWHLPGGGVELGETLIDALTRELREEGNIEPSAPPVLQGIFFNDRISRRDHIAVFVVRDFRRIGDPVPNYEIIAHGFFPINELPHDTTAPTRARIKEVLDGTPIAERF